MDEQLDIFSKVNEVIKKEKSDYVPLDLDDYETIKKIYDLGYVYILMENVDSNDKPHSVFAKEKLVKAQMNYKNNFPELEGAIYYYIKMKIKNLK